MKKEDVLEVTITLSAIEGNMKYQSPHNTFLLVGMGLIAPLEELFSQYEDSDESKQWAITMKKIEKSQELMKPLLPENWKQLSGDEPEWRKIVDEILFPPFVEFINWWVEKHPEFDTIIKHPNETISD